VPPFSFALKRKIALAEDTLGGLAESTRPGACIVGAAMKPYVICHMMPSVDGRLRTDRWDIPERGHQEYERTADSYDADAWVCGRKTMEEFAKGRRRVTRRRTGKIPRTDFIIPREKGARYAIAIDSHAKLQWGSGEVEGDPLVVLITEDAPDSYLQRLRDNGISYCFAGKRAGSVDLRLALEKLRTKFGVKKLMLEGGGETNGSFLKKGLVDELSLLLTPVADGKLGEPALFDVEGESPKKAIAKLRLKSVRRAASDMLWIKYAVRK
jgi:riboflavin biosynthesis pyrimidine reductase